MWYFIFDIFLIYTIIVNIATALVIFWIYANADYLEKTGEDDDELDVIDYVVIGILLSNPIIELILLYFFLKD